MDLLYVNNMFSKLIISFISVNIFGSFGPPQQSVYIKDSFRISYLPCLTFIYKMHFGEELTLNEKGQWPSRDDKQVSVF